jgi:hypothetical protein
VSESNGRTHHGGGSDARKAANLRGLENTFGHLMEQGFRGRISVDMDGDGDIKLTVQSVVTILGEEVPPVIAFKRTPKH